ncbi:MAG: sugar isomerase, partial [Alphaproteobacteria bacterium]|nr:sugar isomerase [Alphaproteobacteria bacterium]
QSHNVTDPIESLMLSASDVQRAYAQALLVDRADLLAAQQGNDALAATQALRQAYRTDVEPILAMARFEQGGAIDLLSTYRASGYRQKVADVRPAVEGGSGGIV